MQEELYNYRSDPRNLSSPATILLTPSSNVSRSSADPNSRASWRNGTNGPDPHPLAWWREGGLLDSKEPGPYGGGLDDAKDEDAKGQVRAQGGDGRSWYTSLGHEVDSWKSDVLRSHIFGGIVWTLKSETAKGNNESALVGQRSSNSNAGSGSGSETNPINTSRDPNGAPSSSMGRNVGLLCCLAILAVALL